MGKSRIAIRKLETPAARQNTYSKRKYGIVNKAEELSILCDVDILLLMFSPGGKPTLFTGANCNFNTFVERLSRIDCQERLKRTRETLEVLKKALRKVGKEMDLKAFTDGRTEELKNKVHELQEVLTDANHRLSCWTNVEQVDDIVVIRTMEETTFKHLDRLEKMKEYIARRDSRRDVKAAFSFQRYQQEQHFPQVHNIGIDGASSSNAGFFSMAQRDAGSSNHPIQPHGYFGIDQTQHYVNVGINPVEPYVNDGINLTEPYVNAGINPTEQLADFGAGMPFNLGYNFDCSGDSMDETFGNLDPSSFYPIEQEPMEEEFGGSDCSFI